MALVAASANLGLSAWLARDSATFEDLDGDCATALRQLALLAGAPDTTAPDTTAPPATAPTAPSASHPAGSPA